MPCIHEQDSDANQQFQRVYIDGKDTSNVSLFDILIIFLEWRQRCNNFSFIIVLNNSVYAEAEWSH